MGTKELHSAAEVVDELDGNTVVAAMTGRTPQQIWNWKTVGRLPPDTYITLRDALWARGCAADPSIWGLTSAHRKGRRGKDRQRAEITDQQ